MLLKKQTVWLLTMLSLVIVLSVYYVTTPTEKQNELANTVKNEDKQVKENSDKELGAVDSDVTSTTKEVNPTGADETFETVRMEITDERNKLKEELTVMMANTELSAKERNEAKETFEKLSKLNETEMMLETLIVSMKYDAALVRADDNDIKVTVKASKLSKSAANDIIRLVSDEIPTAQNVTVEVQPSK